MILHEPMDNGRSTNQILYYSSPKTSEDAHEFIMAIQEYLIDELKNSEKNPGWRPSLRRGHKKQHNYY